MSNEAEKYVLDYYTANDPDPGGVPFKYRSFYIESIVEEAWRIRHSGGRATSVSKGRKIVFDENALEAIMVRVSEFDRPMQPLRDAVLRALQELNQAKL